MAPRPSPQCWSASLVATVLVFAAWQFSLADATAAPTPAGRGQTPTPLALVPPASGDVTSAAVSADMGEETEQPSEDMIALGYLWLIGAIVSLISLSLVLVLHLLGSPRPMPLQLRALLFMAAAYLVALIVYFVAVKHGITGRDDRTCRIIGVVLHYTMLSAFFWMAAQGAALYRTFVVVFLDRESDAASIRRYALVAQGCPALIVGAVLAGWPDEYGSHGSKVCFLSTGVRGAIWAFIIPAVLLSIVNTVVLIKVLRSLKFSLSADSRTRLDFRVSAAFSGFLGVDWVVAMFMISTTGQAQLALSYVFTILNGFCGLVIFLFHGGLDLHLWRSALSRLGMFSLPHEPSSIRNKTVHTRRDRVVASRWAVETPPSKPLKGAGPLSPWSPRGPPAAAWGQKRSGIPSATSSTDDSAALIHPQRACERAGAIAPPPPLDGGFAEDAVLPPPARQGAAAVGGPPMHILGIPLRKSTMI
eukprot:m.123589 g.123589  ORF g.123589 m.123589 type:complete len:475 (+) comp13467_c0_seq3:743-2167(+)